MKKSFAGAALALTLIVPSAAFAQNVTTTGATVDQKAKATKTLDLACISKAVETRETSIMSTQTKFSSAWQSALSARKDALVKAWGTEDATTRRTARQAAWTAFDSAMKTARTTNNTERTAAWTKYQADRAACGVNYVVETSPVSERV